MEKIFFLLTIVQFLIDWQNVKTRNTIQNNTPTINIVLMVVIYLKSSISKC